MKVDVIVIGAGASGLMCASEAGKRGRHVLVLEHTNRVGKKILLSGGGRCNFSNRQLSRDHYLSQNPHFVMSALSRFTPDHFLAMLDEHRIGYEERDEGQLFCTGSSQQVVTMLQKECERAGVQFLFDCAIEEIRKGGGAGFQILTTRGGFACETLVVATGGLSMPAVGATQFGYAVARQFGLKVTPLSPALTPFTFSRREREEYGGLSGVSLRVAVRCAGRQFRGDALFTHRGFSGPAMLQMSSYWDGKVPLLIDLLPDIDLHELFLAQRHRKILLTTLLDPFLPGRFVKIWCSLNFPSRPLNQYSSKELESLAHHLHHWPIKPAGTEGFNKAEVTLGGVDTTQLSSKTMEAKAVPGLYFLGEVVDVTGHLGGYNLHWAWASGHAAGQCV